MNAEASDLKWLSADCVNSGNWKPVTWNGTSASKNGVTSSEIVQNMVDIGSTSESNSCEHSWGVETETVESNVEQEPWTGCTQEDSAILPLSVKGNEVAERGLWNFKLVGLCESLGTAELIRFALGLSVHVSVNILSCLLDITSNIEGITRGFGDGETEVESDNGWDSAESYSMLDLLIDKRQSNGLTDHNAPRLVNWISTDTSALGVADGGAERIFKTGNTGEHNERSSELTKSLHGEDGTHHCTSPFSSSKPVD
jgi:hypothetical protein